MRRRKVRLEPDGFAEAGDSLIDPPLLLQHIGQVVVRIGKVRFEPDRSAVAGNRVIEPALRGQGVAEVGVIQRDRGFHRDRLADPLSGQTVMSALVGDHTEQMEAIGVAGLNRENLKVETFGFAQAPGLMALQRGIQRRLNGGLLWRHVGLAPRVA